MSVKYNQLIQMKSSPSAVTPLEPPKLVSVQFRQQHNCMCQAVLRWQRPGYRVHQFVIVWGPSREPRSNSSLLSSSTIIYNTDPFIIQIPGVSLLSLEN